MPEKLFWVTLSSAVRQSSICIAIHKIQVLARASAVIYYRMHHSEEAVTAGLLDAQAKAQALFAEVETRNLIHPGTKESQINEDIYTLAEQMYGI
jgi:hypothetical protein